MERPLPCLIKDFVNKLLIYSILYIIPMKEQIEEAVNGKKVSDIVAILWCIARTDTLRSCGSAFYETSFLLQ